MNKIYYALGVASASNLIQSGVRLTRFEHYLEGFRDTMTGNLKYSPEEIDKTLGEFFTKIREEQEQALKKEGEDYLNNNKTKDTVRVTKTGLQYRVITEGTGKSPNLHSQVEVNYEGRLVDGTKFDSSYDRGQTVKFGLGNVIAGWTEGLQLMKEGAKYEFAIPYDLAYGPKGIPGTIPPYSTLIFTVELVKVL